MYDNVWGSREGFGATSFRELSVSWDLGCGVLTKGGGGVSTEVLKGGVGCIQYRWECVNGLWLVWGFIGLNLMFSKMVLLY